MENSFGPHMPGGLGHIGECAVAVVVKEMALPERGDEEIVVAVVVVVADRHAQAEHRNRQPGFASHVGESAVVIVVIELQAWSRRPADVRANLRH